MPPPAGPTISTVIWAAILSASVVAAIVTGGLQLVLNWIKRRAEVEDRDLARTGQIEDRVFDARRHALVSCAQALSAALQATLMQTTPPTSDMNQYAREALKRANDAYIEFILYSDEALGHLARRQLLAVLFGLNLWTAYSEDGLRDSVRRSLRKAYDDRDVDLDALIRAELGVESRVKCKAARSRVDAAFSQFTMIQKSADSGDDEVVWSAYTAEPHLKSNAAP